MPSSITHQLIAEEALALFPPEAKKIAEKHAEYFLGAQGPDFLFFYRIGNKSEYNLGKFLHRYRVYDVFNFYLNVLRGDALPNLSEARRETALAYILGYLTHYCADSTFHPFVYNYTEAYRLEKRQHQQMENDWDVWFLREMRGKSAEKYKFPFSPKEIIKDGTAQKLYAALAHALGREEVTKGKFARGLKNFQIYLNFFHGKCYRTQRRWEKIERFFHAKGFFSRLYPREIPEPAYLANDRYRELSEGRGKDADELFDRAVSECGRLAKLFLHCVDNGKPLPREEFGNSLLTAKPCE